MWASEDNSGTAEPDLFNRDTGIEALKTSNGNRCQLLNEASKHHARLLEKTNNHARWIVIRCGHTEVQAKMHRSFASELSSFR